MDGDVYETNEISSKLLEELEAIEKCSLVKDEKLLSTIHSLGITLWNLVIAKKTSKKVSPIICARGMFLYIVYSK